MSSSDESLTSAPTGESSRAGRRTGMSSVPRSFYNNAAKRVQRATVVLGLVGAIVCAVIGGYRLAVPFIAGAAVSLLNFTWLAKGSSALLAKVVAHSTEPGMAPTGRSAPVKFVLRYVLVAAVAYVTLKSSVFNILGLFAGLFLTILALMVEALYEVWVFYRRGV